MLRTTRRQFCEHLALGVGASSALSVLGCPSHPPPTAAVDSAAPPPSASARELKTLAVPAFATLSAVCERLLPRDQDPGAIDLGVPTYIDAMMVTPALASVREMLSKVLPIIDKESKKKFAGKAFADIAASEQDSILDTWQHGSESRQHFFDVILSLTMEGAFGDPKYGGNVGGRGFDMIGFRPDPPLKKMAMDSMPGMQHGSVPE